MNFLIGPMRSHLNGHKELTTDKNIFKYIPDKVYIPLVMGNTTLNLKVEVGESVKVGTLIAANESRFYVPVFSSVSGKVIGIEKRFHTSRKKVDHLVIENDKLNTIEESLEKLDYKNSKKAEIVEFIKNKGIVGLGGAGFPAYVKYQNEPNCETFIINAVECEPYITADYKLIATETENFKVGVETFFYVSGAKKCYVAVKESKKAFIKQLESLFKDSKGIEIAAVPDVYPMGWERTLVFEILGRRYKRLPIEIGCIISNATTAIALTKAMINGTPIVEKVVTFSGDGLNSPTNVLAPVGTPVGEIVKNIGGYNGEDILIIAGGPMMGAAQTNDDFVIETKQNAITILQYQAEVEAPCLRCGSCVRHCPAGLQPVNIMDAVKTSNTDRIERLDYSSCIECGLCTYVCPSKIEVTEHIRRAKRYMALKKKK